MKKGERIRIDSLAAEAFRREEKAVGQRAGRKEDSRGGTIPPEYRLPGSERAADAPAQLGRGRDNAAARAERPRVGVAFAFALALFAAMVLVPSLAATRTPGFAGIAAAGLAGSEEFAGYGKALAEAAGNLGN